MSLAMEVRRKSHNEPAEKLTTERTGNTEFCSEMITEIPARFTPRSASVNKIAESQNLFHEETWEKKWWAMLDSNQ